MLNPISHFKRIWQQALDNSPLQQQSAVCVSTVNEQGFPEGRFVDLKAVDEDGFTFCTYLDSEKAKHLAANAKVAMTIWWDHIGVQVRVVGEAQKIGAELADHFWQGRNREAQITTLSCRQSQPLASENELTVQVEETRQRLQDAPIPRPENWGGYVVKPLSIEFLTFNDTRLHLREKYQIQTQQWQLQLLQP